RKLAAARLGRRGVAPPAAGLAALFVGPAVPPALAAAAVRLAAIECSVPASVAALSHGVLRRMFLARLKRVALSLVLTATAAGLPALVAEGPTRPDPSAPQVAPKAPQPTAGAGQLPPVNELKKLVLRNP